MIEVFERLTTFLVVLACCIAQILPILSAEPRLLGCDIGVGNRDGVYEIVIIHQLCDCFGPTLNVATKAVHSSDVWSWAQIVLHLLRLLYHNSESVLHTNRLHISWDSDQIIEH